MEGGRGHAPLPSGRRGQLAAASNAAAKTSAISDPREQAGSGADLRHQRVISEPREAALQDRLKVRHPGE
jgi:hypothetical protein